MKTKKNLLTLFSAFGIVILLVAFYAFKDHHNPDEAYTPQPQWENLKVLPKDISEDSLEHLMKNFATALGVKCSHCHTPKKDNPSKLDFPNDDKIEKEIARGMIKMTNDLNKNYFQPHFPDPKPKQVHVVNCVMCHRGTTNPEKYLSQMNKMYKTYDPDRDNRKEKFLEKQQKK